MTSFYQTHLYQDFFSLISTVVRTHCRNIQGKKFEPEIQALSQLIKKDSVCIDVGGAYGRYAYPLSKIVGPKGKIYSFEPGRYSYTVFWWIKLLSNLSNVTLIKKAVSDKPGQIHLCLPQKESGKLGASLAYVKQEKDPGGRCETVEMVTLDDEFLQDCPTRIDLIKCDTEGSELFVFKGARQLIEKFRPVILIEIDENNLKRYQLGVADILSFFSSWDYRLMVWQAGRFLSKTYADHPGNYFLIPQHIQILDHP